MANSPARSVVDVGSVIAGTYTIEGLLGRGGMGAVFLASHARLPGKKVAIKLLHAEISDAETLARFKREAQIASMLGHPNIVHVEDFDVMPDGTPYLVLEYLHGETLASRLQAGPIPLEQILSIVRQVGSALAAAHRAGVVHRDLKPQNIFLVPTELDGRPFELAKVLDFGISKMRGSQTVKTQESALLGTPQYMAPEQATGQQSSVDERTDIFALGAIVYEMVVGHPAFVGGSIPEVVFKVVYEQPRPLNEAAPTLPPAIASAVQQAMAKPQGERFATVNSFVEALTGEALKSVNRPAAAGGVAEVGPPTPKSTKQEAFDKTVGSGDHSDAVAPTVGSGNHGVAPVAAAPLPSVRPSAPTMATVQDPATPTTTGAATGAKKRSKAPIAIAAVLACAAGGVGVFAVMKGEKTERAAEATSPSPSPNPTPTPNPSPTPSPNPNPTTTAATTGTETTSSHPTTKTGATAAKLPKAAEATDEPDAAGMRVELKDAEAALAQHRFTIARGHANRILNAADSTTPQRSHAHALLAIVACHADNDQEGAQNHLRQVGGPRLRVRVINACREDHINLAP